MTKLLLRRRGNGGMIPSANNFRERRKNNTLLYNKHISSNKLKLLKGKRKKREKLKNETSDLLLLSVRSIRILYYLFKDREGGGM